MVCKVPGPYFFLIVLVKYMKSGNSDKEEEKDNSHLLPFYYRSLINCGLLLPPRQPYFNIKIWSMLFPNNSSDYGCSLWKQLRKNVSLLLICGLPGTFFHWFPKVDHLGEMELSDLASRVLMQNYHFVTGFLTRYLISHSTNIYGVPTLHQAYAECWRQLWMSWLHHPVSK